MQDCSREEDRSPLCHIFYYLQKLFLTYGSSVLKIGTAHLTYAAAQALD